MSEESMTNDAASALADGVEDSDSDGLYAFRKGHKDDSRLDCLGDGFPVRISFAGAALPDRSAVVLAQS